ncbi:tetratricopeptide repeat protein [Taibaiella koreensis]|uniref:tetratricopeptide repeat protein n=1 Tax=Taibaiella koreensis TaxID=1268548 RepID=UPI000E59ECD9|nr:tetratricopeptide repeat protein [Taibaiella koreensis]
MRFPLIAGTIVLIILQYAGIAAAQTVVTQPAGNIPQASDTVAYVRYLNQVSATLLQQGETEQAAQYATQALAMAQASGDEEGASLSLATIGDSYAAKGNSGKALSNFIRSLKIKNSQRNHKLAGQLYRGMAVAFARMKQYPLALKYFHKSAQQQERQQDTSFASSGGPAPDSLWTNATRDFELYDDLLDVTADGRLVVDKDTIMIADGDRHAGAMTLSEITAPFDDGKKAIAYGILLHFKQPVAGTRKAFTGINTVGHMFITLTKFNADSGYVSRTFGFYPDKDYLLSATPLMPGSTAVFKDDAGRDWDELMAKFVSKRKFNRILRMVMRYSRRRYHLNKNNCTDFGLVIAGIAGIRIKDTRGSWPLGSGNNPGDAGQSVQEGKVEQLDSEQLFIYPAPPTH